MHRPDGTRFLVPGSRVILLALALGLASCSDDPVQPPAPPDDPGNPADTLRPPDPGLSYTPGCLREGPIENCRGGSLPPDAIPALLDPVFMATADVDFMLEDDRMFGIEIAGRVFGFPRKIMNYHEAATFSVFDDAGDLIVRTTATWCPLTFSFLEWRNDWKDPAAARLSSLGVSGALLDNNLVLYDRETRTQWSQILGLGVLGERTNHCLEMGRNTIDLPWSLWKLLHPESVVVSNRNGDKLGGPGVYFTNPYGEYWAGRATPPEKITHLSRRLPLQTVVLAVRGKDGGSTVVMRSNPVEQAEVQGVPMVFFHEPTTNSTFVFENTAGRTYQAADPDENGLPRFRDEETGSVWSFDGIALEGDLTGERLAQIPAFHVYWFAWGSLMKDVEVINF